jgi:NAD(P)-dependent dehydrogenase (short-subunit alcohol dehydrogenase family)
MDYQGKVVAITGGARGIGLAMAQAFHAKGAKVALADLDGAEEAAKAFGGIGMKPSSTRPKLSWVRLRSTSRMPASCVRTSRAGMPPVPTTRPGTTVSRSM